MSLLVFLGMVGSAVAMQAPEAFKSFKPHTSSIASIQFNGDNQVVTGSLDGSVKITGIDGVPVLQKLGLGLIDGAFLHDNKTYLAVASSDFQGIRFYPLTPAGNPANRGEQKVYLHHSPVSAILALNDIATVSGAQDGSLVAIFKGGRMVQFPSVGSQIISLAKAGNAPNNMRFLALSQNGNLLWFDAQVGRALYQEPVQGAEVVGWIGETNPNQARWAIGYRDGTIQILDSIKGLPAVRSWLKGHTRTITALAGGFKDPYLVSGSADGMVKLWNAATGQELKSFNVGKSVSSIAAIANAQNVITIAVGSLDGSVVIYKYDLNAKAVPSAALAPVTTTPSVPTTSNEPEEEVLEAR